MRSSRVWTEPQKLSSPKGKGAGLLHPCTVTGHEPPLRNRRGIGAWSHHLPHVFGWGNYCQPRAGLWRRVQVWVISSQCPQQLGDGCTGPVKELWVGYQQHLLQAPSRHHPYAGETSISRTKVEAVIPGGKCLKQQKWCVHMYPDTSLL